MISHFRLFSLLISAHQQSTLPTLTFLEFFSAINAALGQKAPLEHFFEPAFSASCRRLARDLAVYVYSRSNNAVSVGKTTTAQ